MHFSAEALSPVFTSDKLLLTVLINVLHPNVKKIAQVDSADAVETSGRCSGSNVQLFGKAVERLWRQKSAAMPAKQECVNCNSRRLSEPLIRSVDQMQSSQTSLDTNSSQPDRIHNYSSAVVGNSWLDGAILKPSGSRTNAVSLGSKMPSHGCVVTDACSKEPLVVNFVYRSDDRSTLKSLSFEKNDSCLNEHTSSLHVHENTLNGCDSNEQTSLSLAQEERCNTTTVSVVPPFSDSATEETFTSDHGHSTSSCGDTDGTCQVNESDDEARDVCARFAYRKVCVYLQEGTWRHSPHSLHCIRIDDNISLIVLCEVMRP